MARSKEKNSFYYIMNILITFNLHNLMLSENQKILLDYKSERNVTTQVM